MSIFPYRIYFENLNADLNLYYFFFLPGLFLVYMNESVCRPVNTAFPLFSGCIFLLLFLTRENSGILWKPQGFWIWEGQPFISEEKGNLIENRGYFWFFQRNFSSPSFYLPSDGILLGSSEPTVRWLASDLFQILSKDKHAPSAAVIVLSGDCILINLTVASLRLQWIPNLSWFLKKKSPRKFHRSWWEQDLGLILLSNL